MHEIVAYEALRAHALGEALVPFVPLGLAVLRHYGLAAWLAHEAAARELEGTRPSAKAFEWTDDAGSEPCTNELVQLLAGTVLLVMKARS